MEFNYNNVFMKKELTDNDTRLKKLLYRSWHRGCKETDIILGRFADENLHKMDFATIDIYEKLLDEPDTSIWDWLVGTCPPEKPEYAPLLTLIEPYGRAAAN